MNSKTALARAWAYHEAATHLELDWTENDLEAIEGRKLAGHFFAMHERWLNKATELQKREKKRD